MLGLAKSAAAKETRGSSLGEKASKDRGTRPPATGGGESYWEIRPASAHCASCTFTARGLPDFVSSSTSKVTF
jgi:hypothetical protein